MPQYEFKNLETNEIEIFYFSFKNVPSLGTVQTIDGREWKRVITSAPYGIVKGSQNPMDAQAFVQKSGDKKGTVGNLLDESKELSEKRKKIYGGRDPVQEKYFDKWSAKRGGKQHPADERPHKKTPLKIRKNAK